MASLIPTQRLLRKGGILDSACASVVALLSYRTRQYSAFSLWQMQVIEWFSYWQQLPPPHPTPPQGVMSGVAAKCIVKLLPWHLFASGVETFFCVGMGWDGMGECFRVLGGEKERDGK